MTIAPVNTFDHGAGHTKELLAHLVVPIRVVDEDGPFGPFQEDCLAGVVAEHPRDDVANPACESLAWLDHLGIPLELVHAA